MPKDKSQKAIELWEAPATKPAAAELDLSGVRALLRSDRDAALSAIEGFDEDGRKQLFLEIVALCSFTHDGLDRARRIILSMPRDWVRANVEDAAEFQLISPRGEVFEEFGRLIELFSELDTVLAERLARRAAEHPVEEVRAAGREFLGRRENPSK